jgi:hypothetical protein
VTLGFLFLPGMCTIERGQLPIGEARGQVTTGVAVFGADSP